MQTLNFTPQIKPGRQFTAKSSYIDIEYQQSINKSTVFADMLYMYALRAGCST